MKAKFLPTLFLALVLCSTMLAQTPRQELRGERIEQLKIAFLTRQIDLTVEEAARFWPLYNAYQKVMTGQHDQRRQLAEDGPPNFEKMTDNEINTLIDSRLAQAEAVHKARVEFLTGIREFLPPVKVARYFRAEEQFRRQAMERLRERQQRR